jgi:hypothetical protein
MSININLNLNQKLGELFNISNEKAYLTLPTSSKLTEKEYKEKQIKKMKEPFNKLYLLILIIEEVLFKKVLSEILIINSSNGSKSFHKDFDIIFSIFKKIYEARDTKYFINKITKYTSDNYILKFIISLDDKEFDFIESLLNDGNYIKNILDTKKLIITYDPRLFKTIYKKYKHTKSNDIYNILGDDIINDSFNDITTILNPNIKKNKHIIIPEDNASNLKKLYFILLVVFSSCIKIILDNIGDIPELIRFLKKILLNYNKNTVFKDPNEDVEFAIVLGCICFFKFSFFIETIANKIIEEKNKKNIDTKVKSAKDISDLFEIFLELNISEAISINDIGFINSNIFIIDFIKNLPNRYKLLQATV